MRQKFYVRVSLAEDGKTPIREVIFDGEKIGEVSFIDLVEFLTQAPSTLRYEVVR